MNAGIRNTLGDADDRGHFWAYNNGITIIARTFEFNEDEDTVELTDFSIVNGCQTTVSLGGRLTGAALVEVGSRRG